ncbi:MAG: hypothetical protein H6Q26_730 [Bacteroidetes bacterium]|uniref:hypothetical protein n=2 Tax=unclassified Chitinophaga TaxID=2619133 RepID=UPI001D70A6D8|nr:hypothetical protein [[Flexibacter] sp. ATCC 35208]MBP1650573.1 hypothetical protein [Bacteroidota bacterium]
METQSYFVHLRPMTMVSFIASLDQAAPPGEISPYLKALWWDGKGNWQQAHDIIEHMDNDTAAWVHAYLHRKEGDRGNARYWYNRAGRSMPESTLDMEWTDIVTELINT